MRRSQTARNLYYYARARDKVANSYAWRNLLKIKRCTPKSVPRRIQHFPRSDCGLCRIPSFTGATLISPSPKLEGFGQPIEREKMSDEGPRVRFCDEYEFLMAEFLRALSAWAQLRCFQKDPDPSDIPAHASTATLTEAELARSCGSYVAAMWALRMHSRDCLLCEETLRVRVNGTAIPARLGTSCC